LATGLPTHNQGEDMKDHLIQEEDQRQECGYCHNALQGKWESIHLHEIHYKKTTCGECERDAWVKADFLGSGHDEWNEKKKPVKPLDDHITEIEDMKVVG